MKAISTRAIVVSPLEASRFWAKVVKTETCWLWTRSGRKDGYGQVRIAGTMMLAHRVSYTLLREPIPDGLTLDHLCRVRMCVKPEHLEPVPMGVNVKRAPGSASAVNEAKTTCPRGHPYDVRRPQGWRRCRACDRESLRRWRARQHARN